MQINKYVAQKCLLILSCNLECSFTFIWTQCNNIIVCTSLFIQLYTGASTSSQPGHQQVEPDSWCSLANTTSSRPSSTDSSPLCTPQMSPQICPGLQISDSPSDSHALVTGTTIASCAPCSEPQENSTGGKQEVEEAEEPKSCKKHLHCPTCKVTVNSSLQLEAHCSGV